MRVRICRRKTWWKRKWQRRIYNVKIARCHSMKRTVKKAKKNRIKKMKKSQNMIKISGNTKLNWNRLHRRRRKEGGIWIELCLKAISLHKLEDHQANSSNTIAINFIEINSSSSLQRLTMTGIMIELKCGTILIFMKLSLKTLIWKSIWDPFYQTKIF